MPSLRSLGSLILAWPACAERRPISHAQLGLLQKEGPAGLASVFEDEYNPSKRRAGGPESGLGSAPNQAFAEFLNAFFTARKPKSVIEVSCGHWPSGWQREGVRWPPADYLGIDIVPSVIESDDSMLAEMAKANKDVKDEFGFNKMHFKVGDMTAGDLPKAELLITKDTLIHLPNAAIKQFLSANVLANPPKYRYVLFVHDSEKDGNNNDIAAGQFHTLDLASPPFQLEGVKTVFQYVANRNKIVQLLEFPGWEDEDGAGNSFSEWHAK